MSNLFSRRGAGLSTPDRRGPARVPWRDTDHAPSVVQGPHRSRDMGSVAVAVVSCRGIGSITDIPINVQIGVR